MLPAVPTTLADRLFRSGLFYGSATELQRQSLKRHRVIVNGRLATRREQADWVRQQKMFKREWGAQKALRPLQ